MIVKPRILALARAEAVLLRRNPSGLAGALVGPALLAMMPLVNSVPGTEGIPGTGALLMIGLITFTLTLSVYYNLVTALVARREEFVLKRLRTGEISDAEIIAGTAAPGVAIAWGQIALGLLIGVLLLDLGWPADPAWLLVALLGVVAGTALCVLLAAAVTTLTSTVEMAQLTASPLLILSLVFSGASLPVADLPEPLSRIAQGLPLTPVVDLIRFGLTGTASIQDVVLPVLVLGAWFAVGAWIVHRWFRWEPRR
jgi:ABC-2 type transport system permease protein